MIDLKAIIKARDLKTKYVAESIFPNHKHANAALISVFNGRLKLNSDQLLLLSQIVDIPVQHLYSPEDYIALRGEKGLIRIWLGGIPLEFDPKERTTSMVMRNGNAVHVVHEKDLLLTDYIKQIKDLITKHN